MKINSFSMFWVKSLLFSFFILFLSAELFSIDLDGKKFVGGPVHSISFNNSNIEYVNLQDSSKNFSSTYKLIDDGKYIILETGEQRFLLLISKYSIFLLDQQNMNDSINGSLVLENGRFFYEGDILTFSKIETSSYLIEHSKGVDILYDSNNLRDFDLSSPWVEGEEGSGIGNVLKLYIDGDVTRSILFFNGFIDPKRTYLFEQNNRVKKIEIRIPAKSIDLIYDLDDTPQPQLIMLPEESRYVEIEILDIYRGSKYDDTCIAGVYRSLYNNFLTK